MRIRLVLLAALVLAFTPTAGAADWREGDVRFKVTCTLSASLEDDPIVYPGQPGAAHLHDFFGVRGVTASTDTYPELLALRSTCNDPDDHAAYWVPAVLVNGVKRAPGRMSAYYRRNLKHAPIQPYPDGLKIVAEGGDTGWQCNGVPVPMDTPAGCTTDLTVRVHFPDCWDGVNLDSPDHRSHMAYAIDGQCPPSHPVPVPSLQTYTHYGNLTRRDRVTLSSGDPTTLHGDFFNGWTTSRQALLVADCLNLFQRCDSGG